MGIKNPFRKKRESEKPGERYELRQFVYLDSLTLKSLIASYSAIPESSTRLDEGYEEISSKATLSVKPLPMTDIGAKADVDRKVQTARKVEINEKITDQYLFTVLLSLLEEENKEEESKVIDFDCISSKMWDLEDKSDDESKVKRQQYLDLVSNVERGDVVKFTGWCYLKKETNDLLYKAHNPTSTAVLQLREQLHNPERQPTEREYEVGSIFEKFGIKSEKKAGDGYDTENIVSMISEINEFKEAVDEMSTIDFSFLRTLVWPDSLFHYPYFMTLKEDYLWEPPERITGMRQTIVGRVKVSTPRDPQNRNEGNYWKMIAEYDVDRTEQSEEDAIKNRIQNDRREYPYNEVGPKIVIVEPIAIYW